MQAGPRPGDPVPPYLVGQASPPGLRVHTRSQATGSIVLPILGLVLVALIGPVLPWFELGGDSANQWELAEGVWDTSAGNWTSFYVGYGWLIMALAWGMIALAATLDSRGLQITIGVLFAVFSAGTVLLTVGTLIFASAAATGLEESGVGSADDGMLVAGGIVLLVMALLLVVVNVLLFALKGLAYRIPAGLAMLFAAVLHAATVADMGGGGVGPEPGAYLASFGYFLCALGCFIGPRYIRFYAPAT